MTVRGIVVLEGADGTGKTTLAKALCDTYNGVYLHNGVYADCWAEHLKCLKEAVGWAAAGRLVVIDRLWLSEQVYGQVFRGGPQYDLGARCLDRVLQRHGALNVICYRNDLEAHVLDFEISKTQRVEQFTRVVDVARIFHDLVSGGNVAQGGDTYLDQLVRFGDYRDRIDVMTYDLDVWRSAKNGLTRYVKMIADTLNAQFIGRPTEALLNVECPNLVGSIHRPRVLFVGEQLSKKADSPWPFVWRDDLSAATWLNASLHRLHFDETRALWTNAIARDSWYQVVTGWVGALRVVALGGVAARHCREVWRREPDAEMAHPQWWRRFHHGNQREYDKLLQEAIGVSDH